jgi:hypothetical protein
MDGKELNDKIKELCQYDKEKAFIAFGGKPIPYIGWYWRDIDFDNFDRRFGVIPANDKPEGYPLVGFMANNKWFYRSVEATKEQWNEIRRLLEIVADDPTKENLSNLNDKIQGLIDPNADYSVQESDG